MLHYQRRRLLENLGFIGLNLTGVMPPACTEFVVPKSMPRTASSPPEAAIEITCMIKVSQKAG